ncbi:hypothetical protein N9383_00165 [Granulosicoccus sp.]|nr:hypothetical protein [Granulosicoccus sp.]
MPYLPLPYASIHQPSLTLEVAGKSAAARPARDEQRDHLTLALDDEQGNTVQQ